MHEVGYTLGCGTISDGARCLKNEQLHDLTITQEGLVAA